MDNPKPWKVIVAFIIDVVLAFIVFGYLVAAVTGNLDGASFQLNGGPALLVFALVIAYVALGNRLLGGTLGRRLLGIAPGRRAA